MRFAGVSGVLRMTRAGGSVGRGGVDEPPGAGVRGGAGADGGDKIDRDTRREPSRGQNFASAG